MKWPQGSLGAKEQKENRIMFIVLGIITLALLAVQFLIPSQYRTEVIDAPTWMNWVGGILTAGSIVPILLGARYAGETKPFAWTWIIMIALGFFFAAGWFDNPHSYLNN